MMNVRRPSPLDGAVLAYHNSGMGLFEKDLWWNNGQSMKNYKWHVAHHHHHTPLLPLLLMPIWCNSCSFEKDLCWNNGHSMSIMWE